MKRLFSLFLLISFFLVQGSVRAASIGDPSGVPLEVQIGQAFTVRGELNGGELGEVYFLKCRIGPLTSTLNEGQTYNPITDVWLFDNGAWIDMPTVEVLNSPTTFSLQCKVKADVEVGQKLVFLRACLRQADGSCSSSFQSTLGVSFMALIELFPTPTLTPTSTLTPTLTLTPSLTSTLTPTPTPKKSPCDWACKKAYFFQRRFLRILFSALPFKKFWWK